MITVCLYGGLRKYGRRFDLHAETPAEALHALFVQIQGLRQAVRDGLFQVRFNGQDQNEETIESHFRRPGSGILHIVPRVAGAGKAGQFVAGVALIAFAWWNPFGWAAGGALLSGVYSAGIGLALGGVAQMLTKRRNWIPSGPACSKAAIRRFPIWTTLPRKAGPCRWLTVWCMRAAAWFRRAWNRAGWKRRATLY